MLCSWKRVGCALLNRAAVVEHQRHEQRQLDVAPNVLVAK